MQFLFGNTFLSVFLLQQQINKIWPFGFLKLYCTKAARAFKFRSFIAHCLRISIWLFNLRHWVHESGPICTIEAGDKTKIRLYNCASTANKFRFVAPAFRSTGISRIHLGSFRFLLLQILLDFFLLQNAVHYFWTLTIDKNIYWFILYLDKKKTYVIKLLYNVLFH